ncbi:MULTISPECIES: MOSC domain-containing protein [unclassified Staphylococcus]|uniref:MOSC domain-containing protein n=1 Tax=unclassified Staphylococcus TaxID=91994 RepID=UPI0021D2EC75|nr:MULTISPECIES: MOSC domain-containing protein [unclassified Staphylococcus]UXR78234.1 MOSC domain-containing protein [Staphylococcus sp. IVB6227]UXR82398.1 MOSC domain-containing protein [Staphylococcus sp. IVB6214]
MTRQIQKLYIGKVKEYGDPSAEDLMSQTWTTAAFKQETSEPVWLGKEGLQGDAVGDTRHHGGAEKALFAYAADHYAVFSTQYEQDIPVGSNGENISVVGMDEQTVCISDVYQVGEAVIQVSQPRRPCWKPSRRLGILDFAKMLEDTGKTGWYYRVLKEGHIQQGDALLLQERPHPDWTIQRMNDTLQGKADKTDIQALQEAGFTPKSWHASLEKRLTGASVDDSARLYGPNI